MSLWTLKKKVADILVHSLTRIIMGLIGGCAEYCVL